MTKIIIVDDEQIVLNSISRYLQEQLPEFEICGRFYDGKEALEYLLENPVDLVLTDICMPVMDGLALSREIHKRLPQIVVIIFSGFSEFEYAQTAIRYNVYRYLLKPIDYREIKEVLLDACAAAEKRRSAPRKASLPADDADRTASNTAIQSALAYIKKNYAQDLSVKAVASAVFLSPSHFSYLFKKETGTNFVDYLTKVRMQNAIELMKTNMRVNDIAEKVGYQNRNRFIINFRQYTSCTPTEYRKKILSMEED